MTCNEYVYSPIRQTQITQETAKAHAHMHTHAKAIQTHQPLQPTIGYISKMSRNTEFHAIWRTHCLYYHIDEVNSNAAYQEGRTIKSFLLFTWSCLLIALDAAYMM